MTGGVLMVSPIPSHPQNQGNSARIFRMGRTLQQLGLRVHFLYFGMEGLDPDREKAMRRCWDQFHYIKPEGEAAPPSFGDYYHIDDWYDERVSLRVRELCRRFQYSICLVNYVWFSKVLEAVPAGVRRVIDTHDVFGDRHLVARAAGMEPVWFYTSKEQEGLGLSRADLVLAIQEQEQEYFRGVCNVPVEVIGHMVPARFLPDREQGQGERLRIGYLGSGNPFNEQSIRIFQDEVLLRPELFDIFEFHLAGSVCDTLGRDNKIFTTWGMVDTVAEFYREMDVMVNPMVGGTGLKIKSLEAMAFGRPLVATRDAMVGIDVSHDALRYKDVAALVQKLPLFLDDEYLKSRKDCVRLELEKYNKKCVYVYRMVFDSVV